MNRIQIARGNLSEFLKQRGQLTEGEMFLDGGDTEEESPENKPKENDNTLVEKTED